MVNSNYTETSSLPEYVNASELERRLGPVSLEILEKKYLEKRGGKYQHPAERIYTVAKEVANIEMKYDATPEAVEKLTKEFYNMIANLDFLPGGRVLSNAGTDIKSLPNCYVLPVQDDLGEIYQRVAEAAIIHKYGGGTGYNFSDLRPRGWKVKKGIASGPVSFAGQFDKETEVINSGNRRGANMGILNIDHVDIFEFIRAKDISGLLTNFNISVGITDEFMKAYKNNGEYCLKFEGKEITSSDLELIVKNCSTMKAGSDVGKESTPPSLQIRDGIVYNVFPEIEILRSDVRVIKYKKDEKGNKKIIKKEIPIGRVDEQGIVKINARKVFEVIAKYAHSRGDPGILFLDSIEKDNMLPSNGRLNATNPCGEQPLHPYDACNLGSLNLKKFVRVEKNGSRTIDYSRLEEITRKAVRFMDNVNDLNEGPIPKIEETIKRHRRIGLGVMGFADMLMKMRIGYDAPKGYELAEEVMEFINKTSKDESIKIAKEKGVFPAFNESNYNKENERVRNLARTTIAPTGSISMVADVNSGIEPWFGLVHYKKMRGGDVVQMTNSEFRSVLEEVGKTSKEIEEIIKKVSENQGSCQGIEEVPENIQKIFKIAKDIQYESHIEMQARFQRHVDNAISKTINMSGESIVEDILNAYVLAYEKGCKGITVYRDGSLETQVLETEINGSKYNERETLTKLVLKELHKPREGLVFGPTIAQPTPYNHKAFISLNYTTNGDGKLVPYEAFFQVGKAGGDLPALAEMAGRITSAALKAGVPPEYIAEQLMDIGGETQTGIGSTKVKSLPDAFGKALILASKKMEEIVSLLSNGKMTTKNNNENGIDYSKKHLSGNLCGCGAPLYMEEGCQKCHSCGYSKC